MAKSLISLSDRRVLGVALAQELAKCKPGRDYARLAILNRLYLGSLPRVQIACRVELEALRMEQRNQRDAAHALRRRMS